MPRILTQRGVEAAKPQLKRTTVADGVVSGLNLIVQPTGAKVFRLWTRVNGKQVPVTIGDATLMTLADARAKAKAVLGRTANGEDPREARDARKAAQSIDDRVEQVVDWYIAKYLAKKCKPSWAKEAERLLRVEVVPKFGKKRLGEIEDARRPRAFGGDRRARRAAHFQPGLRGAPQTMQLGDDARRRQADQDLALRRRQSAVREQQARAGARRRRSPLGVARRRQGRLAVRTDLSDCAPDRRAPGRGRGHGVARTQS